MYIYKFTHIDSGRSYIGQTIQDPNQRRLEHINGSKYSTRTYHFHNAIKKYGIDSFIFEEEGELRIRVMTEINYLRTMGRVTYELSEKFSNDRNWTALLMIKKMPLAPALWKLLLGIEGIMVLSPGDSRFEIILRIF